MTGERTFQTITVRTLYAVALKYRYQSFDALYGHNADRICACKCSASTHWPISRPFFNARML